MRTWRSNPRQLPARLSIAERRALCFLVASAEARSAVIREKEGRPFPLPSTRNQFLVGGFAHSQRDGPPKGSRGRSESPLVASAEAKSSVIREKEGRSFPLPSTRNQFLVGGFVRLRADEVLSITGKYPKGAGGGQRVHVSWPPPDPPLLSSSAPLASQGRAQLGSRPSLGGPLSPSAQLIPPPAPPRRFILGVSARDHYGRNTLLQYVPQLRCHAKCVPDAAPVGREIGGSTPAPQKKPAGFPTCGLTFIPHIAISPHEMPRG